MRVWECLFTPLAVQLAFNYIVSRCNVRPVRTIYYDTFLFLFIHFSIVKKCPGSVVIVAPNEYILWAVMRTLAFTDHVTFSFSLFWKPNEKTAYSISGFDGTNNFFSSSFYDKNSWLETAKKKQLSKITAVFRCSYSFCLFVSLSYVYVASSSFAARLLKKM